MNCGKKGFNLDDWEIGFQSDVKLHKTPTKKDIENGYRENELIALFDLPAHWLMSQMNAYCVGVGTCKRSACAQNYYGK